MPLAKYPLQLRVDVEGWRLFTTRKFDGAFNQHAQRILLRDEYMCQFCGFQGNTYQEVVNIDGNYLNNRTANLATACPFCAQALFIQMVGKSDYGGGTIIYAPEISQADLNGLCHVLFSAIANGTDYSADALNIYNNIRLRSRLVEDTLGEGLSDPAMLGQMLTDTPLENRHYISETMLMDLRMLPSRSKFQPQIQAWARSTLDAMIE